MPDCRVYDHRKEREWRHMNFFQFRAVIVGQPPRVLCDECHKPKTAKIPWARERSGFSLYFEAFMVLLAKAMSMNEVSRLLGEHDTTLRCGRFYTTKSMRQSKNKPGKT